MKFSTREIGDTCRFAKFNTREKSVFKNFRESPNLISAKFNTFKVLTITKIRHNEILNQNMNKNNSFSLPFNWINIKGFRIVDYVEIKAKYIYILSFSKSSTVELLDTEEGFSTRSEIKLQNYLTLIKPVKRFTFLDVSFI